MSNLQSEIRQPVKATTEDVMNEDKTHEIFIKHGEEHYVWPMIYLNGNHTRCRQCRYYLPHAKQSRYWDGECTSVCENKERGYLHRKNGNDYVSANGAACKWFFLKNAGAVFTALAQHTIPAGGKDAAIDA